MAFGAGGNMAGRRSSVLIGAAVAVSLLAAARASAEQPAADELPPYAADELEASRRSAEAGPSGAGAVELEDFYRDLSPYGRWVDTPEYGYVFVPEAQFETTGWRPYLFGQWVWTEYGWTWASSEPFGWATYHYGRWTFSPALGWCWIPGFTWGPAWVAWRFGAAAIGWAPLYPGFIFAGPDFPFFADDWLFISPTFFFGHPCDRFILHRDHHVLFRETRHAGAFREGGRGRVFLGPPPHFVEAHGGGTVHAVPVVRADSPARAGVVIGPAGRPTELRAFRPRVSPAAGGRVPVGSGLVPVERTPSANVRLPAPRGTVGSARPSPAPWRGQVPEAVPPPRAAPAP
ncbi:MAG TPA: DUF6600 domain-containing protein, partial [Vulgatibacter sp.]